MDPAAPVLDLGIVVLMLTSVGLAGHRLRCVHVNGSGTIASPAAVSGFAAWPGRFRGRTSPEGKARPDIHQAYETATFARVLRKPSQATSMAELFPPWPFTMSKRSMP